MQQAQIDQLRSAAIPAQQLFVGGKPTPAIGGAQLDVVSPIDGHILTTIADADGADVDLAVKRARLAFEKGSWSGATPAQRKKILLRFADLIEQHALEIAVLGVRDNGTEIGMAYKAEPLSAAATIRYYAEAIDKVYGEIAPTSGDVLGLIHREPLGVVGVIVPWNFPLMIGAWKIGPALAAGNSVVVKPPEIASLSLLRLAELASEAGLPDGVLNVVTGRGASAGEALALHMEVDAIGFTGSTRVGRRMYEYAGKSNLKRVYNELGGKSAFVVFDDFADVARAARTVAGGMFFNQGESCNAPSRVLVHERIADEFVATLRTEAPKYAPADPLDARTEMGALVDDTQLRTVLGYIESGSAQGARIVSGGRQARAETGGYYVEPTVFDNVTSDMKIAQEEIFGPVMSVLRFKTEDEAIALANNSSYGLQASCWSDNINRAHRVARALRAGTVHVNQYDEDDITVPFGGYKQSGNGRDKSLHAFDKYTELKTTWIRIDGQK